MQKKKMQQKNEKEESGDLSKEEEIKAEIDRLEAERDSIIKGRARITEEEERRYNNLAMPILELRRKLY